MRDLYYTQRQRKARHAPDPHVGADFWAAYRTYIGRLSTENYLCKAFPGECCDGIAIYSDNRAIASRLREELGQVGWPIGPEDPPESERILDLVEFFYRHVAKPTNSWFHDYSGCMDWHPTEYDARQGRYEYTIEVNKMLKRFHHPYKLQKGRIIRLGSEILDERILTVEVLTDDDHLKRLLNSAIDNFFDRTGSKKLEGLRSMVDAFERLKTLEDMDKKKSVEKVIAKISPNSETRAYFDEHLRKMTELSNRYTIRHHEVDKVVLADEAVIDYLFYGYYNLVRLILEKYNLVK